MSNQKDLLVYLRGLPKQWWSCKDLHKLFCEDNADLNYKCISRMMSKLYQWNLLKKKKDKNQKHGYLYKLI